MKIRFFIAFAVIVSIFGLSSDFYRANGAAELNAKCRMPNFEEAYEQSKAVFLGEVVEEEKQGDTRRFTFKVEKYWKGANAEQIEISVYETARYQAWFEKDKRYLVYAFEDEDGNLRVGRCSRSNNAENAKDDLQKLGKGKSPR